MTTLTWETANYDRDQSVLSILLVHVLPALVSLVLIRSGVSFKSIVDCMCKRPNQTTQVLEPITRWRNQSPSKNPSTSYTD